MYIPYAAVLESVPRPIVLDGKGLVTLDGNNATRILQKGWRIDLTVQRMAFVNGRVGADAEDDLPDESGAGINVENWDGRLTVIDCSFTNCHCTEDGPDRGGGAIYTDGVSQNADAPRAVLSRCDFLNNTANDHAGAVFNYTIPGTGSVSVVSRCTFADNLGTIQWNGHTVWTTAIDGGGNVQWPQVKDFWGTADVPATATVVWSDPLLGPLQDNGGPTQTRLPSGGSPAIDAGSTTAYPSTDQRDQPRPIGTGPDAGAVETP